VAQAEAVNHLAPELPVVQLAELHDSHIISYHTL
jgi:hypothetical protein